MRSYQYVTKVRSLDVPKNIGKPCLQLQRLLLTLSLNLVKTKVGSVERLCWSCKQKAYRTLIATCETLRCHNLDNQYVNLYSSGEVRYSMCDCFPIPISKAIVIEKSLIVNYVLVMCKWSHCHVYWLWSTCYNAMLAASSISSSPIQITFCSHVFGTYQWVTSSSKYNLR
jgi:hypothetical protein